jgi:hypothetical protein
VILSSIHAVFMRVRTGFVSLCVNRCNPGVVTEGGHRYSKAEPAPALVREPESEAERGRMSPLPPRPPSVPEGGSVTLCARTKFFRNLLALRGPRPVHRVLSPQGLSTGESCGRLSPGYCLFGAPRGRAGSKALPERHQWEHVRSDPAPAGQAVPFHEIQLLEALEDPEWNVDQDALRVEDPAVELVRQSFARPAG